MCEFVKQSIHFPVRSWSLQLNEPQNSLTELCAQWIELHIWQCEMYTTLPLCFSYNSVVKALRLTKFENTCTGVLNKTDWNSHEIPYPPKSACAVLHPQRLPWGCQRYHHVRVSSWHAPWNAETRSVVTPNLTLLTSVATAVLPTVWAWCQPLCWMCLEHSRQAEIKSREVRVFQMLISQLYSPKQLSVCTYRNAWTASRDFHEIWYHWSFRKCTHRI